MQELKYISPCKEQKGTVRHVQRRGEDQRMERPLGRPRLRSGDQVGRLDVKTERNGG